MAFKENKEILLSCKKEFIIKLIISIILVVLLLIIPLFYSYAIDYINGGLINKALVIFIVFGIISLFYHYIEIINQKAYFKLYSSLYKKYMYKGLEKTCNNSLYSLSRFSLSEYSNILSEDFEFLSDYYSTLIIRIVELMQFIYIMIYFFFINDVIGYITLFLSIMVISFLFYLNKYVVRTNERRKEYNDLRISLFQEVFLSIKEIKGFNIYSKIKKDIELIVNGYIKRNNKLNIDRYNLRQVSLSLVDLFKVICLIYSTYLISIGNITIGVLIIVYSYYTKLSELFTSIILLNESLSNVKVAKKRIYKLFQYADDKEVIKSDYNDVFGVINFSSVLYGNRKEPSLNEVNITFKENSFNVLTGDIKSCRGIYELLLLYNRKHSGIITIDDVNIEEYSHDNISNIIGLIIVPPIFFNKSIKDNLLLFDNSFDNIVSVCKYLDIHVLIMSLPNGYGTTLYNSGSNINNDLRYMLSFTKIFLKKSRIIIIEDFFAYLTKPYRRKIMDILNDMKKEHTIIVITKNVSLIKDEIVDQVVVFKKGKVIAGGIHIDLMKQNKEYKQYIRSL